MNNAMETFKANVKQAFVSGTEKERDCLRYIANTVLSSSYQLRYSCGAPAADVVFASLPAIGFSGEQKETMRPDIVVPFDSLMKKRDAVNFNTVIHNTAITLRSMQGYAHEPVWLSSVDANVNLLRDAFMFWITQTGFNNVVATDGVIDHNHLVSLIFSVAESGLNSNELGITARTELLYSISDGGSDRDFEAFSQNIHNPEYVIPNTLLPKHMRTYNKEMLSIDPEAMTERELRDLLIKYEVVDASVARAMDDEDLVEAWLDALRHPSLKEDKPENPPYKKYEAGDEDEEDEDEDDEDEDDEDGDDGDEDDEDSTSSDLDCYDTGWLPCMYLMRVRHCLPKITPAVLAQEPASKHKAKAKKKSARSRSSYTGPEGFSVINPMWHKTPERDSMKQNTHWSVSVVSRPRLTMTYTLPTTEEAFAVASVLFECENSK